MEAYERLEKVWAEWNGLDPAGMVACSSGTAALHLALEAFQLPQGSRVIVPDFTMIACPRAVSMAGLEPVFMDCDERLLMDTSLLPSGDVGTGNDGPLVVMVVHIYGRRLNLDMLHASRICGVVIEDLAEAHGVKPHPQTNAACWSFFKNKVVAGEEGGAVWFKDRQHADLARLLRCQGFTPAHDFAHVPRGHNYRMANALAEKVLMNFEPNIKPHDAKYVDLVLEDRRVYESWFDRHCPDKWRMPPRDVVWVYDVRIPRMTSGQQGEVVQALNAAGIPARHGFKPMHSQPEYSNCDCIKGAAAERASREVIYLCVRPGRTKPEDAERAFEIIRKVLGA